MLKGRRAAGWLILTIPASELTSFLLWNGAACRPLAPPLLGSGLIAALAAVVPETRLGRVVGFGVALGWALVGIGRDAMEVFGTWWWWAPGLVLGPHWLVARSTGASLSDPIGGAIIWLLCSVVVLLGTARESWLTRVSLLLVVVGMEYRVALYLRCLAVTL